MKKLNELLGQRLCKGDVGVEIECEGESLVQMDTETWRTEPDGSLRGRFPEFSAEYVMRQPVMIQDIGAALDEIIQEQANATLNFSFRTSVHVHVNVQHLTEPEMLAFLYLCLLVEEPLMNFCGESRKGNRFCLRYSDAEGYDKTLDGLFLNGAGLIPVLNGNQIRYAAINVHSLRKYGSIEFRGMRGTMDKAILQPWCETLVCIREFAKTLGTPEAVYNRFISIPNDVFLRETLGMHTKLFAYEGDTSDVERSFSLTIDLPHIHKSRPPRVEKVIKGVKLDRVFLDDVPHAGVKPAPVLDVPLKYMIKLRKYVSQEMDNRVKYGIHQFQGTPLEQYLVLFKECVVYGNRYGWNFLGVV